MFVCGSTEGLLEVGGRKHNVDDLTATVLAVEPQKFVYRGRYVRTALRAPLSSFLDLEDDEFLPPR